jgi:hypothetical protein
VPDGLFIHARIADYQSAPVVVKDERYQALTVAPPNSTYFDKTVTFHLDGVQAGETDSFAYGNIDLSFDLTFPSIPPPTPTPTLTPTITPTPSSTPTPTATPIVLKPAVYSGRITVAGGKVPADAVLVARMGSYESSQALVDGDGFRNLVVHPNDVSLLGTQIEFFLDGIRSDTTHVYQSGAFDDTLRLIFVGIPTPSPTSAPPTPTPTPTTPPEPTATPTTTPPTPTTVLPEATATLRPTRTPRSTPIPPTPTSTTAPPPPTATAPPTAVPEATPTPESGGGACSSTFGRVSPVEGMGNILVFVAPLALIAGYRRWRR